MPWLWSRTLTTSVGLATLMAMVPAISPDTTFYPGVAYWPGASGPQI